MASIIPHSYSRFGDFGSAGKTEIGETAVAEVVLKNSGGSLPRERMLGYKTGYCIGNESLIPVVILLDIPKTTRTNCDRSTVAVPETAKYRADCATVLRIEDLSGNEYTEAQSYYATFYLPKSSLTYRVGETLTVPDYTADPLQVCGRGIHFFRTRERALAFPPFSPIREGVLRTWHDNGRLADVQTYVGPYEGWYDTGVRRCKGDALKKEGEYWYPSGQLMVRFSATLREEWWPNGVLYMRVPQNEYGERHGLYQAWHNNGQLATEVMYENGQKTGVERTWDQFGVESTRLGPYLLTYLTCRWRQSVEKKKN